jgi:hypothetical protein
MSKDQPAKKPRRDKAAIAEAATLIEPNRALLEKWNAGKYGLRDFTNFLVEIARDSVSDPRLVEKEPTKLHRHSEILSHTVTELERFGDRQSKPFQEQYRHTLWQALGSASLIASYLADNPFLARKTSVRGVAGTLARSRDIDEAITIALEPVLQKHLTWKTGRIVDSTFVERVNKELTTRKREPLERDTIVRHVNKLRMNDRLSD